MKESDISVAIAYPGNRVDKLITPLKTTDLDLRIGPKRPFKSDIVLLDNADRDMILPVLKKRLFDAKVLYRMRGNVYVEMKRWHMNPFMEYAAYWTLSQADGCIAITPHMASEAERLSNFDYTGVAGLAKRANEWPDISHSRDTIHAITLTNIDYKAKIEPLVRYANVVSKHFKESGGKWHIYGEGIHENWLAKAIESYDNIEYRGYTETPKETIQEYNTLFHFSDLDALPNAILEGFTSNLPVITNDFIAFTESSAPNLIFNDSYTLKGHLEDLENPRYRSDIGCIGRQYVKENHSPERIGRQFVRRFKEVLNGR